MRRNAALVIATALACGAGTVAAAAPAHAAGWTDVPSTALTYDGSLDRVDFGSGGAGCVRCSGFSCMTLPLGASLEASGCGRVFRANVAEPRWMGRGSRGFRG